MMKQRKWLNPDLTENLLIGNTCICIITQCQPRSDCLKYAYNALSTQILTLLNEFEIYACLHTVNSDMAAFQLIGNVCMITQCQPRSDCYLMNWDYIMHANIMLTQI